MPLNLRGEHLAAMKSTPIVMPIEKWMDSEFFEHAAELAEAALGRAEKLRRGWKGQIRGQVPRYIFGPNEVLVQVYPFEWDGPAVAFIFMKQVQGTERYAPFIFRGLSHGTVAELRQSGRWPTFVDVMADPRRLPGIPAPEFA